MVYGLLHYRIRKRVNRDDVQNFNDLLQLTRAVERTLGEKEPKESKSVEKARKAGLHCVYCKNYGHTKDICRKLKRNQDTRVKQETPNPIQASGSKMEETVNSTSTLTCYGCGKKGFIKSNCPDCRKQNSKNNNVITTARIAEFYTEQYNSDSRFQPLVSVEMLGQTSVACIDTGARGSLADPHTINVIMQLMDHAQPARQRTHFVW
ncbi:uncharacterized protein LOC115875701 [Sitophilus oryzae]|uniref:Uncharacterized protein LOC115875701 n=1 Tax=Sitophilus oryzae TaxID=7048 RepID=A0A6J2X887_SITOR|nr:uncharacterized protein LOC115875701 [Sitophilus oryzae]